MTRPVPSDTDVDLVARAIAANLNDEKVFEKREMLSGPHWDAWRDVYRSDARAAVDALARAGRLRDATTCDETRTEELERFRQHSVTLNSVGWRMAVALGDVPEGADRVEGNPLEQVDRLIAELERLRGAPAPSPSIEETPRNDTA